jgi:putative ABC transport system substrate-binding protein
MAYLLDFPELYRYAAHQVADVLRGGNPATMPFYQPPKENLVINTKTAQRVGLTVPPSLLLRADEVIE